MIKSVNPRYLQRLDQLMLAVVKRNLQLNLRVNRGVEWSGLT